MSEVYEGEVLSKEDRISALKEELEGLQGESGGSLQKIIGNPGQLKSLFQVNDSQARNLKALITGGGASMSVKYLGKQIGDVPAALIGAGLSAFLAGKLFGK